MHHLEEERFLGLGDATTVSDQFLEKADALPRRHSHQIQIVRFHQIFAIKI
jgi:hypothetical protein